MEFRTIVDIPTPPFVLHPQSEILCVGSCFADKIGQRFRQEHFSVESNPFGVMYNPVSIGHTVARWDGAVDVAIFTLGTNHVYVERSMGEVVDNCQKRPQRLFEERELSVEECCGSLANAIETLRQRNQHVKVIVTVSPIRYRKYGYRQSKLSKAVLLLAANQLEQRYPETVNYFPAYEIVDDELRDYRFYQPDMLHPTQQTVDYIWERFAAAYLDDDAKQFLAEWKPLKEGFAHRPFHPESEQYQQFAAQLRQRYRQFTEKWQVRHVFDIKFGEF